jgi:hypothetical protein
MANFPFNDDGTLASTIGEHGARVPTQAALDALEALLGDGGGGVTVTDGTTTVAATTVMTTGTVTDGGGGMALVSNGGGTGVPSSWTFNDNGEVIVSPAAEATVPFMIEAPESPGDVVFSVDTTGHTEIIVHDPGVIGLKIDVPDDQAGPRLQIQDGNGVEFYVNAKGNVSYQVGVGATSALDVFDENGNRVFKIAADGSVHIKTGTSIVADL